MSTRQDPVWADFPDVPTPRLAEAWLTGLEFNRAATTEVLSDLMDAGRRYFLYRRDLPAGVLDLAVVHPDKRVFATAAESGQLSPAQWERLLAATADHPLHGALAEMAAEQPRPSRPGSRMGIERPPHPDACPPATPAEIAAMAEDVPEIGPEDRSYALWWVAALHDDPDAMRQLARSPKLWIRRSVARAPHLPRDVVELLARDQDRVVHLFLSESCEDAPPELLLDVWSWWSGSFSFPGRPRNHPDFPRDGLLRFADDPRPRIRLLALDDPGSTVALVERFSRDPDPEVRARAAEDPRLPGGVAAELTGDTDGTVRAFARRNPAVPPARLVALLLDEDSADDAAQNPAIPLPVMRRMLARAAARQG